MIINCNILARAIILNYIYYPKVLAMKRLSSGVSYCTGVNVAQGSRTVPGTTHCKRKECTGPGPVMCILLQAAPNLVPKYASLGLWGTRLCEQQMFCHHCLLFGMWAVVVERRLMGRLRNRNPERYALSNKRGTRANQCQGIFSKWCRTAIEGYEEQYEGVVGRF